MKNLLLSFYLLTVMVASAQMKPQHVETPSSNITGRAAQPMSDIWDVFKSRRSVRSFTQDTIPEADIVKIINAARMAPTSGNQQPWKFFVIRDKDKINLMKQKCVEGRLRRDSSTWKGMTSEQHAALLKSKMDNYYSAPVYIIILTDNHSTYPDYNHWDGPLAAGYLMLAARALGYGTVFITDAIPESITKEVFNIPDTYTRVCITPLGVPAEWPKGPEKKPLEGFISFDKL
jgi:nitroreductase